MSAVLIVAGLADTGQIDVGTEDSSVPYASDVVFGVFWHMADAVPAVGIPSVWGWKNPITVRGDLAWLAGVPLIAMRFAGRRRPDRVRRRLLERRHRPARRHAPAELNRAGGEE